jgi:hypothetical protein
MQLPDSWIDRVFTRLSALYGRQFLDMWSGCDLAEVKSAWSESLGGFTGQEGALAIAGALKDCEEQKFSPSLPEFKALVRARFKPAAAAVPQLAGPVVTPEQVAEAKDKIAEFALHQRVDFEWPNRILARQAAGEIISPTVIRVAKDGKEALRV